MTGKGTMQSAAAVALMQLLIFLLRTPQQYLDSHLSHCSLGPKRHLYWFIRFCGARELSCGFTSRPTQNRSFRIRSSQPISWLSTEN